MNDIPLRFEFASTYGQIQSYGRTPHSALRDVAWVLIIRKLEYKEYKSLKYDLEERTAKFAEDFINLVKKLPQNSINRPLIEQGVAAVGSIGANYCEATEAESKRDFSHKISIGKKEIKETRHWIRLLACANSEYREELRRLWREAQELLLIFSKIIRSNKK